MLGKQRRALITTFLVSALLIAVSLAFTGCGNDAESDQSGAADKGTKTVSDENRSIFENYVREKAEHSDVVLGEEFNVTSDASGLISYAVLETEDGLSDRLLTVSSKSSNPVKLEVELFGAEGGAVKELDQEEINFNDAGCFGGEYDLFLTNSSGKDYLFVKRNNVVDSSSVFCEGLLYQIGESIEKDLDAQANGATEGFGFLINDGDPKTVSTGGQESAFSDWAEEANQYLKEAGLTCEGDYYDVYSFAPLTEAMPDFEEGNSAETHLCFIRKGRQENGSVDDFEHKDILEINDYTGVAELMAGTPDKKDKGDAKADSPIDYFLSICEIGHDFASIDKKYDIRGNGGAVMDAMHQYKSDKNSFEFLFIATIPTEIEWDFDIADTDECIGMYGTARDMFGIEQDMSVEEFAKESGLPALTAGSGASLGSGGYEGVTTNLTLEKDIPCTVLLRDVDEGGTITPETMVYADAPPQ